MSVAALTVVTAGASFAQTFSYGTVFSPNPIPSSGGIGNYITAENGANGAVNAAGIGSDVNLTNFVETSNVAPPSTVNFSQPFTIALSVTPVGGTTQTQDFTGTISGQYNTNQSLTATVFNAPSTLTFNFGSLGSYTFSNLSFVPPGPQSSATKGAIAAYVTYAPPSSVPEPASFVPFALGGLGLLALIVRKTRRTSGATA